MSDTIYINPHRLSALLKQIAKKRLQMVKLWKYCYKNPDSGAAADYPLEKTLDIITDMVQCEVLLQEKVLNPYHEIMTAFDASVKHIDKDVDLEGLIGDIIAVDATLEQIKENAKTVFSIYSDIPRINVNRVLEKDRKAKKVTTPKKRKSTKRRKSTMSVAAADFISDVSVLAINTVSLLSKFI